MLDRLQAGERATTVQVFGARLGWRCYLGFATVSCGSGGLFECWESRNIRGHERRTYHRQKRQHTRIKKSCGKIVAGCAANESNLCDLRQQD